MDRQEEARRLNNVVGLVGLRAQATAVGLVQLCAELGRIGVLDNAAIGRIRGAIADQVLVSHKASRDRANFEAALHRRLQKLFPFADEGGHPAGSVGTSQEMGERLDLLPDDDRR